jgi:uncharacterized protein YyaL (SSP411 family)
LIQFQKYYPKDWLNDWIQTTFSEMTAGGLWDWVDGGFSRYSVDHRWHIPHFEKMLYDNAQLYKVFAILQKITPNPSYELIKEGIDRWLEHFLKSPMNLYYSATDADSEGEEGKYFCWEQSELQALLKNEFDDLDKHFDVSHHSYWEDGKIVLRKRTPELPHNWHQLQEKLINKRKEKTPPQTDQKILLSWNALLVQAWCVSDIDVSKAVHLFERLKFHFYQDGKWWGTMYENGMLKEVHSDGLAFTLKACLDLYFQTSNLQYWQSCQAILNQLEATFKDNSSCYYYFSEDSQLFVATKDLDDQVIPSSNAVIAECLYWMGILDGNMHWIEQAREMTFKRLQMDHPLLSASHWLQNQLLFDQKASIIIHGSSTSRPKNKWHIHRFIQIHSSDEAPLIMKNKSTEENLYYVCNTEQCNTISPHIEEFLSPS